VCSTRGEAEVVYPVLFAGEILDGKDASGFPVAPEEVGLLLPVPLVPDDDKTTF
jgi:hypothetical protein